MKVSLRISLLILLSLFFGFMAGSEYKAYQIKSKLDSLLDSSVPNGDSPSIEDDENSTLVNKSLGEDVEFATLRLKVISSQEKATLAADFSEPAVAHAGAKFVVVSVEVENTTDSTFNFSPFSFDLKDRQGRIYESYDNLIGSGEDYLAYRDLSPSISEKGVLIYEVPESASSYSLIGEKKGTNEIYSISIK